MTHTFNQKGFAAIEALLSLIAAVLIIFVGYYVWHSQRTTSNTYASASKVAQATGPKITKPEVVDPAKAVIYKDDTASLYQISLLASTSDQKQLSAAIDAYCRSSDTKAANPVGATGVPDLFTNSQNAEITQTSASINMSCYDKGSKDVPWGDAARYVFVKQGTTWKFSSAGQS